MDKGNGSITGLGLSYADVQSGSFFGEKTTGITTKFKERHIKQSITYGRKFDKQAFLNETSNKKVLFNTYSVPKGWTLAKTQEVLFKHQDKWLSNKKNQKKYGFSYYSTLNKK